MPAASAMKWMVDTTFLWVSMTPRGWPVLPEVYCRKARSSSVAAASVGGGASTSRSGGSRTVPTFGASARLWSMPVRNQPMVATATASESRPLSRHRGPFAIPPGAPRFPDRWLVNPGAERRQRRVRFAVSQIEHRDDVPGPAGADHASKILEPVDGTPAEADDHVAIAQARLRCRRSGEDAREPKTIGPRAGQGDDAEERAAGRAALAPARRRHLRVDRTGIRRQTPDDAHRDGSDASHAGRVDLVRGIGRSVGVLVAPGVEEQDRDAGVVEPAVVGGPVWRALEGGRDPFLLRRLAHERP